MRTLTPLFLIIVAIFAGFFWGKPLFDEVQGLRADNAAYEDAIAEGKKFDERVSTLASERDQFSPEDLDRLTKMIPNNMDNVRLVIEINDIAKKYSSGIKNIRVTETKPVATSSKKSTQVVRPYGTVSLGFSIATSYDRFQQFLKVLESNLRLADVSALSFIPTEDGTPYTFDVTVRTYWLNSPIKK